MKWYLKLWGRLANKATDPNKGILSMLGYMLALLLFAGAHVVAAIGAYLIASLATSVAWGSIWNNAMNLDWWVYTIGGLLVLYLFTRWCRKHPINIGFVRSFLITGILAIATTQIIAYPMTATVYWLINAVNVFDWLVVSTWSAFSFIPATLLFLHPAIYGKRRVAGKEEFAQSGTEEQQQIMAGQDPEKRMLPVPPNFAAIVTWFNGRVKWLQLVEGALFVPWWLGFSVSTAPISTTKVEKHDEAGNSLGIEDRGYYRSLEMFGYVFIGRRLIQERIVVQSSNTVPVTVDVDDIISVTNAIAWQGADNPFGTTIGRLEAALRIGISNLKSGDTNLVRSLFPSLLAGCMIALLKCRANKGGARKGDLVRTDSDAIIFHKTEPFGTLDQDDLETFADEANGSVAAMYKPENGFTWKMVETLTVYEERLALLTAYGCIGEGTSIRDITLPPEIENAAKQVEIEREQQAAEVIEAETAVLTAEKYGQILQTPNGRAAAELQLVERKGIVFLNAGGNDGGLLPAASLIGKAIGGNN